MVASVEQSVRSQFAGKEYVDEDIISYVIACLEDESFELGKDGDGIFDTVGMMLVRMLLISEAYMRCSRKQQCRQQLEWAP